MSDGLLVVTALRSEYLAALGRGRNVERCGMGAARAGRWAATTHHGAATLAIVGVAGALDPQLHAGDIVVATEVRDERGALALPDVELLVRQLGATGMRVRSGPIACSQHLLMGRAERARLNEGGCLCVDMESAAIVRGWAGRTPVVVVRVVVDTVHAGLLHPATIPHGALALRMLRHVVRALDRWADPVDQGE